MTDSELKALIDCLGTQRSTLVRHLNDWTWLVALGVLCEVIFIIWDHCAERGDWKYAQTHFKILFPSKPNVIKLILEIASVVLVVAGIVGELVVEAKIGAVDGNIQDANNRRVALLDADAAALRLRAVCSERQLLDLWRSTLPRSIDVQRVRSKLGKVDDINVGVFMQQDVESQTLGKQIGQAMSGWMKKGTSGGGYPIMLPQTGIWIEALTYPDKDNSTGRTYSDAERKRRLVYLTALASRLQKALSDEHLAVSIKKHESDEVGPFFQAQANAIAIFIAVPDKPALPK